MWRWMVCCVGGGNYHKKNNIILSQSTLVAKSIFKFSCLEILTTGRSPLCQLFRHSKKASLLPSASNDYVPSEREKNVSFYYWSLVYLSLDIMRLSGWAQSRGVRPSWGRNTADRAHRREGSLPAPRYCWRRVTGSELKAKAEWKENHTKENNKEKKWEKGRIKCFIKFCNFFDQDSSGYAKQRASGYTLEKSKDC